MEELSHKTSDSSLLGKEDKGPAQDRLEKVKKAIDSYREYKTEMSFTLNASTVSKQSS